MVLSRRQSGIQYEITALLSQIHPVFMLPPLATAFFGGILAPVFHWRVAVAHLGAIFFAVYTAHVKDGYIDFYQRNEDDSHPLTKVGCQIALIGAAIGFSLCLLVIWLINGIISVLITFPTWLIGYLHAPQLDMHPVGATMGYPIGVFLALVGGYFVQAQQLRFLPLLMGGILLLLLSGIKIIDDSQDIRYDESIAKPTVAVIVGKHRAWQLANLLMVLAFVLISVGVLLEILSISSIVAVIVFGIVLLLANRQTAEIATMLLIRGAYVFLAIILIAYWFHPLE
ncbi:MAG: ubiquinone biosynthesis protein UbiA [Halobacteriaceae archaeon]